MQKSVKIQDDIFEKETTDTIFEDYYTFLTMQLLCIYDNRIYTEGALLRKLRQLIPEIKKEDVSSSLIALSKKDYIGTKSKKNYFPTEKGKKEFIDVYHKLIDKCSSPEIKIRKSFIQEYNDSTGIDPRYLSKWLK